MAGLLRRNPYKSVGICILGGAGALVDYLNGVEYGIGLLAAFAVLSVVMLVDVFTSYEFWV
ncbi:hypothetical protein [Haloarchaeobius sp. HRN-SO-5]|uniref:hypothetical protein n=1 Tax=Haloarchaeobius sp. HRN-SO-5 TaxID=3446118 RepID=UPI003EB7FC69